MNPQVKNQNCAPTNRLWFDDLFTREVDRLFSNNPSVKSSVLPSANVWEDEKTLFIELALPGLKKEEVKIKLENNVLNIAAEHTNETEEKAKSFIRKEFGKVAYSRSFKLNQNQYQLSAIEATMDNGVLLVSLPKHIEEKKDSAQFISVK